MILTSTGPFDEAEEQIRHGMELEPLSPLVLHGAANNSILARRYPQAIERVIRGLEFAPDYFLLRYMLGLYSSVGGHGKAVQELEKAVELCAGKVSWIVGALAEAHVAGGNQTEARRILQELENRVESGGVDLYAIGMIHLALGDSDTAFAWLDKAVDARGVAIICALADPRLDPFRADPRYTEILRTLNLVLR